MISCILKTLPLLSFFPLYCFQAKKAKNDFLSFFVKQSVSQLTFDLFVSQSQHFITSDSQIFRLIEQIGKVFSPFLSRSLALSPQPCLFLIFFCCESHVQLEEKKHFFRVDRCLLYLWDLSWLKGKISINILLVWCYVQALSSWQNIYTKSKPHGELILFFEQYCTQGFEKPRSWQKIRTWKKARIKWGWKKDATKWQDKRKDL